MENRSKIDFFGNFYLRSPETVWQNGDHPIFASVNQNTSKAGGYWTQKVQQTIICCHSYIFVNAILLQMIWSLLFHQF